jgi:chemotaxis protein methyltransferase CheR
VVRGEIGRTTVTPELFKAFREIAYQQAGISLRDGKETLISARLVRRMRDLGLSNENEYLEHLKGDRSGEEMVKFLDAISTNFTSFYREKAHFDVLEEEARSALGAGARRFRVWCAASSSGEEPYTIALTLAKAFEGSGIDHRILATDISTRVLDHARRGRYTERQIDPVPKELKSRYFTRLAETQGDEALYEAATALKSKLVFKRLNLSTPPFPMSGPIDVVMCRNVMIYFDTAVRQRLVSEIERLLAPGALLMIGHSETLSGIQTGLKAVRPTIYRKAGA